MKRFSFCLFFLMVCNCTTIISKNSAAQSSLYNTYFLIKEIIKVSIYSYFYDDQRTQKAVVLCNQCNYTMTSGYLWGYCASNGDEDTVHNLMRLMHQDSVENLTNFLVKSYEQLHIICPKCNQYHGWHTM